jgi:hypothetical protein
MELEKFNPLNSHDIVPHIIMHVPNQDLFNCCLLNKFFNNTLITVEFLKNRIPKDLLNPKYANLTTVKSFVLNKLCLSEEDVFRRIENFIQTCGLYDNSSLEIYSTNNQRELCVNVSSIDEFDPSNLNSIDPCPKINTLFLSSDVWLKNCDEKEACFKDEQINKILKIKYNTDFGRRVFVKYPELNKSEFSKFEMQINFDFNDILTTVRQVYPDIKQGINQICEKIEHSENIQRKLQFDLYKQHSEKFYEVAQNLGLSDNSIKIYLADRIDYSAMSKFRQIFSSFLTNKVGISADTFIEVSDEKFINLIDLWNTTLSLRSKEAIEYYNNKYSKFLDTSL